MEASGEAASEGSGRSGGGCIEDLASGAWVCGLRRGGRCVKAAAA